MVAKKLQIEDTTTTHGPKRVKTLLVEDLHFMTAFALEGYLLFDVAVLCVDLLFENDLLFDWFICFSQFYAHQNCSKMVYHLIIRL